MHDPIFRPEDEDARSIALGFLTVLLIAAILLMGSSILWGCSSAPFQSSDISADGPDLNEAEVGVDAGKDVLSGDAGVDREELDVGQDVKLEVEVDAGGSGGSGGTSDAGQDVRDAEVDSEPELDARYDTAGCGYECVYMYEENPTLEYPWCPRSTHYLMNCCAPEKPTCIQHELLSYYWCCEK